MIDIRPPNSSTLPRRKSKVTGLFKSGNARRLYDNSQLTRTIPLRVHQSQKGFATVGSVSHHGLQRLQSLTKRTSADFRRPSSNTLAHQLTRTCPHQCLRGYVFLCKCRSSSCTRVLSSADSNAGANNQNIGSADTHISTEGSSTIKTQIADCSVSHHTPTQGNIDSGWLQLKDEFCCCYYYYYYYYYYCHCCYCYCYCLSISAGRQRILVDRRACGTSGS